MTHQPFDLAAVLRAAASPDGQPATLVTDPIAAFAAIDVGTNDLDQVLTRVAELDRSTLRGADEVSVSLIDAAGKGMTPRSPEHSPVSPTNASTGPAGLRAGHKYRRGGLRQGHGHRAALAGLHPRHPPCRGRELAVDTAPTQDRVPGAINAYSTRPHAFDDQDLPLARAFAGYAGVAIANARLYHATATLAQQMEAAMVRPRRH